VTDRTATSPSGTSPRRDRSYAVALGCLAAGAVLLLAAAGRTWVTARVGGSGLPVVTVALTGRDLQPEASAVGVLALAGVAGVLALRRTGRLVAGALLLVAGVAAAVRAGQLAAGASARPGYGDSVAALVEERTGVSPESLVVQVSAWWTVSLLGGLLVAAAGLLTLVRSRGWPVMGRRYERTAPTEPSRSSSGVAASRPVSAWDQLDQGLDPTLEDRDAEDGPV
jgi:uncharacterized membrane protein (TIGR02234 family)